MYHDGVSDCPKDLELARKFWQASADQNNMDAQHHLAEMLYNGHGGPIGEYLDDEAQFSRGGHSPPPRSPPALQTRSRHASCLRTPPFKATRRRTSCAA